MASLLRAVVRPLVVLMGLYAVGTTPVSAQVPAAPVLSAEFGGTYVRLQWNGNSGGHSFRIEAGSAPGLADLAVISTPRTDYFAWDVPYGIYHVRVRALAGSAVSAPSNEIVVTTAPCAPPAAPHLDGYIYAGAANLSWTFTFPFGCNPHHFLIEAGLSSGATDLGVFPISGYSGATFPNVPYGTYYVRVRMVGLTGLVGAASNEVVLPVECATPPAIVNPRADVVGNAARFSWQYSGSSASDFAVSLEAGSSHGAADLGSLPVPRAANLGFNAAAVAGAYYTRVRATNACGSTVSPEVLVTLTAECPVPDAIPFIDASRPAAAGSLNVQWVPPDTGGLVIAYDVAVGSAPGLDDLARRTVDGRYMPGMFGFNESFSSIVPDRAYVRVMPINTCGTATRASEAHAIAGACPNPPAPESASATVAGSAVTLTWSGTLQGQVPYQTWVEVGRNPLAADVLVSPPVTSSVPPVFTTTLPPGRYYARGRRQSSCGQVSNASREVTFVIQ